ncbi:MAG TPA: hypothetical protein PKC87_04940, partial [Candidatus Absconditabacterales bacterium]|nr:hypothetical protein [Candidatus Absconditabacterales bacterium]
YLFMLLPPILGYTIIPFGAGLREKVYYKFYELGNNGFYISSYTETDDEEVQGSNTNNTEDEVNVEN